VTHSVFWAKFQMVLL